MSLRILTFNVHGCVGGDRHYDLPRVAAIIRRSQCDIACLQEIEVNNAEEPRKLRSWSCEHADHQPELLAKATGLHHLIFQGPLMAYVGEYTRAQCEDPYDEVLVRDKEGQSGFGNAIISRFEIVDSRSLMFESDDKPLSQDHIFMDRETQPRGARAALIDLNSPWDAERTKAEEEAEEAKKKEGSCCGPRKKTEEAPKKPRALLWVVTTQLSHKMCQQEQRRQGEQLLSFVDQIIQDHTGDEKIGVVICGDFNAAPFMPCSSYSTVSEGSGWLDAWKLKGTWCSQGTYPTACCAPVLGVRLDHVFVVKRPGLAEVEVRSVRIQHSDSEDTAAAEHCSVLVELTVQGADPQA